MGDDKGGGACAGHGASTANGINGQASGADLSNGGCIRPDCFKMIGLPCGWCAQL